MASRVEALVRPELLVWGRSSAKLELEAAAQKIQVKPERLASWEAGKARPTVKQLRKLARAYKRPIAVFYLPEPPLDFQAMHDYRRQPGEIAGEVTPELALEIRRARSRREIALELHQSLHGGLPAFEIRATMADDPEWLGDRIRAELGIDLEHQLRWKGGYEPLNRWRAAIEDLDVLVFQMTDVDQAEARAFSLSETPLPVIVVNIKDSINGRCFSMMHELCHIILRAGGVCDLDDRSSRAPEDLRVEVFCNAVAAAVLVPAQALLETSRGREARDGIWQDEEIQRLANLFGVSREVILRRLLTAGRVSEDFYLEKRRLYQQGYEASRQDKTQGFVPPFRKALSRSGHRFVRTVLASYYQGNITAGDVAEYLDVGLQHLAKLEAAVFRRNQAVA